MSSVRVLVGTRKGAFILTADGKRQHWDVSGPHFGGWEMYHLKGSPADPNRIYASQSSSWFGQVIQRSSDGGKTWEAVGNKFAYDGPTGTHLWYDGTQRPWEFARVWHLEPTPTDPDTVYAGIQDAALFRTTDGGQTWQELPGLRNHPSAPAWQPGAGGMCLHTILLDPSHPDRIFIAISAAGVFRSDDAGKTWRPMNRGLRSEQIPDPTAEVGHCVHRIAMHPTRPNVLFMQKHWDVMRSDDAGETWKDVGGNLPTDFGFPIDVHAHEPETIYVVPIKSDSEHYLPDGKLRVYRSRTGGHEWEALTCISGPPADRSTPRPTPGTAGRLSSAIFRRSCPSRSSRCHDHPGRAAGPFADARPRRRRGEARPRGAGHAARRPRRARGRVSDAARDHSRPGDAAAASLLEIFCLRGRSVQ